MGDPRHLKKKYGSPKKPWDRKILEHERQMVDSYGLTNKRELRRVEAILRKKRANAKAVLALPLEERPAREKELLDNMIKLGIMRGKPTLNDVLSLTVDSFLERRLQTVVWRKRLANTSKQARQFITHGHISLNGKKVTIPSYVVTKDEEVALAYYGKPMILLSPDGKEKDRKQLENEFAEARGEPQGVETPLVGEEGEAPVSPEAADATEEGK
ncbi:MAG: 30S ribosomal protein S4 [Candidatus Diapherotrites archaeon]|nr:30S ribosomal protein S4 [Candidatus Diapherotrites archaeon]